MASFGRPPNRLRGEVSARIDGESRILCLTLGALAELEGAYEADGLAGLCARLAAGSFSSTDLIRILAAGLRGGGNVASDEDVAAMSFVGGVPEMARIAAELLVSAFGTGDAPNPPKPHP
ncbi:gene transfer agent family protein [Pseudohoeflea suaedae]|uniref:Gene transfer agent family protein n=1 Tax=Pseudohoeflea suaedae TaxID=877384 RepID=A0A4R5PP49_9HYPH|nr:gene transfer agent family protein [Pseudohoeflea suaedae]TDH38850.1 gene transfer agent family protein [Pseudohoeflea suaedae]